MLCPFCNSEDSKVLDSRPDPEGKSIRRRRECLKCSKRWRTLERVEDEMPLVIKKNGTHQAFDREKMLTSFKVSCGKRPVTPAQIDQKVADIEWDLLESGKKMVSSLEIGAKVMEALKQLDEIAYVRYASVYRRFKDVNEMFDELEKLIRPEPSLSLTTESKNRLEEPKA